MSLTLEVVRPSFFFEGQMEPSAAVQGVWQGVGWSRFAVLWPFWIQ